MEARRQYALTEIHWLPLPAILKYPATASFALTGYREDDGPEGLFSVYVKTLDGEPGPGKVQAAKLYALSEDMHDHLPEIGTRFLFCTGRTVVAECATTERGEDEP